MSDPIRYDHLAAQNPELYQSLKTLDESAERAAELPSTPGVFTEADLDAVNKMTPGMSQLLGSAVGNATADGLADALRTVRGHAGEANRGPGHRHGGNGGPGRRNDNGGPPASRPYARRGVPHRTIIGHFNYSWQDDAARRLASSDHNRNGELDANELPSVGTDEVGREIQEAHIKNSSPPPTHNGVDHRSIVNHFNSSWQDNAAQRLVSSDLDQSGNLEPHELPNVGTDEVGREIQEAHQKLNRPGYEPGSVPHGDIVRHFNSSWQDNAAQRLVRTDIDQDGRLDRGELRNAGTDEVGREIQEAHIRRADAPHVPGAVPHSSILGHFNSSWQDNAAQRLVSSDSNEDGNLDSYEVSNVGSDTVGREILEAYYKRR